MLSAQEILVLNQYWNNKHSEQNYFAYFMKNLNKNRQYFIKREEDKIVGYYLVEYSYLMMNDRNLKCAIIHEVVNNKSLFEGIMNYIGKDTLVTIMAESAKVHLPTLPFSSRYLYKISGFDIPDLPAKTIVMDPPLESMYRLYLEFTTHFNGYQNLNLMGFKEHIDRFKLNGYYVVGVYENGNVLGYSIYKSDKYVVEVKEIVYDSVRTLLLMLSYLTKGVGYIHLYTSASEQIGQIITNVIKEKEPATKIYLNNIDLLKRLYNCSTTEVMDIFNGTDKALWLINKR